MVDAAEKLGIKPQNLTAALHGRQKTAGGYTWKYADESLNSQENVQMQTENRKLILCVETGEIFHSIVEAANSKGTTLKGISNVLRGRAITSGGFHWKYADDQLNGKVRDESDRCDNRKPVICVETGEIFQSMTEAAKHFGILATGIRDVLNGVKVTTGGYHWHYADGRPDKTRERKKQKIFTKPVICIETGQVFSSVKDAIAFADVGRSTFFKSLKNPDKLAGGLHWKYFDQQNENINLDNSDMQILEIKQPQHNAKPVICIETEEIFPSVTSAKIWYALPHSSLYKALKNPDKTAGGLHWKYFEGEK
ncbi:MAG: hypothetical protein IJU91_05425 [Selenomonadaceae bacterium]|nr:hypothetical protein [Selenomonadaceae bacterium]